MIDKKLKTNAERLAECRQAIRSGKDTPAMRRKAALYARLLRTKMQPGQKIHTTYKGITMHNEII